MPSSSACGTVLEQQLLLQLGERLKRARQALGLTATALAESAGISRMTLRAVEAGEPAPTMGTYLRVMSVLGVVHDLALVATGVTRTPAKRGEAPPSPDPAVVTVGRSRHEAQDLLSLALHQEAVQLLKKQPELIERALQTLDRWRSTGGSPSQVLWDEWSVILHRRAWRRALAHTRRSQELRQASPLPTVLPEATRQRVLDELRRLRQATVALPSASDV